MEKRNRAPLPKITFIPPALLRVDGLSPLFPEAERLRSLRGVRWAPAERGRPWYLDSCYDNIIKLQKWGWNCSAVPPIRPPENPSGRGLETFSPRPPNSPLPPTPKRAPSPLSGALASPLATPTSPLSPPPPGPLYPPALKTPVRAFQGAGVGFLDWTRGRGLIGDEMGLGKTVQALAWLTGEGEEERTPALAIVPAGLKTQWAEETRRFTRLTPIILEGTKPHTLKAKKGTLHLINYEIVESWLPVLTRFGFRSVILDECHRIKNPSAKRSSAVQRLIQKGNTPHVIGLSGTPILNRPAEFFTILNLLRPELFPNWFAYGMRYCGPKEKNGVIEFKGSSHLDELSERLRTIMLRRLKAEVLKDLPDKTRTQLKMEIGTAETKTYREERRKVFGRLRLAGTQLAKAEAIAALRKAAVRAKAPQVKAWIDDFLSDPTNGKLLLWTWHHETADWIMKNYGNAVLIDGRCPKVKRALRLRAFKSDPERRLLVGGIKVLGEGFNLTCCRVALFLELPWTPGLLDQAEDRIHRIGQERACWIYYAIGKGTIEEDIFNLLKEKRKVVRAVLDGKWDIESGDVQGAIIKKMEKQAETE